MSPLRKLVVLSVIGFAAWNVTLTGSEKMTQKYWRFDPDKRPFPAKSEGERARKTLYGLLGGAAIGVVIAGYKKEKPQSTQKPRPPITYGGK